VHPSLQEYTVEAVARDCTNCDQLAQLFSSYQVNKKLSMVKKPFKLVSRAGQRRSGGPGKRQF
jgi:hypothetical protein